MSPVMLTTIQTRMNHYGYAVMMVLGGIGNLFIFILFNRQRHNACSIYLVHSAVTNLLYLISNYFFRTLFTAYNNGSIDALILCKFSSYIPGFLGQVTKTILIMACIDRYLVTSQRATFQAFSTPKRAKYLVFFRYIFWAVAASHQAVLYTVSNGQCTRVGLYATIYTFYAILFIGLIPSVILTIFTCLTYQNMNYLRNRIQSINQGDGHTNHILQRRNRDLLVLVFAEVIVYVITTALFPIVLLETMISQYVLATKSVYYYRAEIFALNVSLFFLYIFSAAPFYTYMVSSASFRRDFQQQILAGYRKLRKRSVDQPARRKNQTINRQETRV